VKKIVRPAKNNTRNNRRVVMVKSVKGRILGQAGEGEVFRAQLVNVSFTGSQIYSNKVVTNNAEVALELDSLDGSHCLVYSGKVVWVRKNPMKAMGRYAYGINFSKVTADQIRFLENNYSLNPPAEG
jgi:hypothetical protein